VIDKQAWTRRAPRKTDSRREHPSRLSFPNGTRTTSCTPAPPWRSPEKDTNSASLQNRHLPSVALDSLFVAWAAGVCSSGDHRSYHRRRAFAAPTTAVCIIGIIHPYCRGELTDRLCMIQMKRTKLASLRLHAACSWIQFDQLLYDIICCTNSCH
jgi:hypothetical protein